jgi:hypothetical protein
VSLRWRIALGATLAGLSLAGAAQADDLKLIGLDGHAVTLSPADIAALPHVSLTVTVEGKTNTYAGVALSNVLAKVGAPSGKALKGQELRDVVLVTGKDGYAVAITLAETDAMVRKEQVILADKSDGAALPDTQAPYRLVIEGDQRGARMARMVTTIELRRLPPTP